VTTGKGKRAKSAKNDTQFKANNAETLSARDQVKHEKSEVALSHAKDALCRKRIADKNLEGTWGDKNNQGRIQSTEKAKGRGEINLGHPEQ